MFGLKGLIQTNFVGLTTELERLFINEHHCEMDKSSRWADFSDNGHECELDEMDRMMSVRLDLTESYRLRHHPAPADLPTLRNASGVMSRAQLLEILRLSERGRGKAKCRQAEVDRRDPVATAASPTGQTMLCVFCRNNGEPASVFASHTLKDARGHVCCPVLYIYTCPICGLSGPEAHTIKYCPLNNAASGGAPTDKGADCLKTARTSCGRRRKLSSE